MSDTRDKILDVGRRMVQSNGYNALSFRQIASEVGIKSAAVHYYFPTKGDLGAELAKKYAEDAQLFCDSLLASDGASEKLFREYTGVFRAALASGNRMCLYGIMAAEYDDLPDQVRTEVNKFTEVNLRFLETMLKRSTAGLTAVEIGKRALAVFSAIEGAQLVARGRNDINLFDKVLASYRSVGLTF